MRKLIAGFALAAAVSAPASHASTSGYIRVATYASTLPTVGGISEHASACDPGGEADGIDGQWFARSAGPLSVTIDRSALGNAGIDVFFYTSWCGWIDNWTMATTSRSESGAAPAGTAYIVVDLTSGADATFTVN